MKALSNIQLLESLESEVENHLKEAIGIFQNLDEEILLRPASNGGWSIAQCLEHLNSYGRYYLPYIKTGIMKQVGKPKKNTFRSTWLGSYFTSMMKPGKSKKYKAFKDHIPPAQLDAYTVVAEFIEQQEELLSYLKQAKNVDLNAARIPISILKWVRLKLGDVLQFIIAHNERHLLQAKRNLQ